MCEGDFYEDGDVDGFDLSLLIGNLGQLDMTTFAANFGRSQCPIPMRQCSGVLSYDTGTPAWHYAVNPGKGIAVRFTPPSSSYPWTIDRASFWPWSASPSLDFEVHVWDDDGPGGMPGTDLVTPLMHSSSNTDQWESINIPKVTIYEGDFYIGWIQVGDQLFYNGIDNTSSSQGRSYIIGTDGQWHNFQDLDPPENRNMMIRQGCQ
jgi:hypothetical protein